MTPEQQHQRDILARLRKRGEQLDELAAAEITRLSAALAEAEKRGYDAAKEQAHGEAVRQGNVYRNNAKGSGLSQSTLDEYQFASAACDYVATAIAAMVKP